MSSQGVSREIRVLHVDDDVQFLELAAEFVERESEHVSVRSESDPRAAVEWLDGSTDEVDCIVSDYDMPGMDGLELLDVVRELDGEVPFVLLTGEGSETVASEAIARGVDDYFRKDSDPDQYAVLAKAIENAVAQRRARVNYREVFENAGIGIAVREIDTGEVVDANERYCDLLGYDREAVLGRTMAEFTGDVPGYTPARAETLLDDAVEEGARTVEWPAGRADGSVLWVELGLTVARIDGCRRLLTSVRDVSERKHRERVLQQLHAAASDMQTLDSVESVCRRTVDAADEILDFHLCAVLIREDDWLVPTAVSEDAPPDGTRRMRIDQGLAGRSVRTGQSCVVDDAREHDVADPARATFRSGLSVPIGDLGVFQAVSEEPGAFDEDDRELAELLVAHAAEALTRVEQQAEIDRQAERLQEFASVFSHDLRNPLSVAAGRLDLARKECDSDHLDAVADAHDRIEELIDDLLLLAEQRGVVESVQRVDVGEVARDSRSHLEDAPATLVVEDDATVEADPRRLEQLFENLLRNAVQHAGPGATVRVGRLADEAGFYVADDGPGIPPDERESVFEPGHSFESDGTGLGLAIVRDIAEAHGWSVRAVESDSGGARFEFVGVDRAGD